MARYDARKVVVATNVAETSLTIEGIRCVIDSGLARMARYDPYRGINTLLIEKISRASADQRAGRAGRTAPGICKRLWAEEEQAHRPSQDVPEIKRMDLAEAVLALKAGGTKDVRKFRWLEPPEEKAVQTAEQLLTDLGALVANDAPNSGSITTIGRTMLAFPVHPRYARMLLAAQPEGCVYQCCLIAALTQGRDLLIRKAPADMTGRREDLVGRSAGSDFFLLMNAWEHAANHGFKAEVCGPLGIHAGAARQIEGLLRQFLDIARKEGLDATRREAPETSLRKCILIGFSDRVARRIEGNRFELVHGRRGTLSRESTVQGSVLIAAAEIHEVEGRDKSVQTVLSLATTIEEAWLYELFSGDIERRPRIFYNAQARRVYAEEEFSLGVWPLAAARSSHPRRTKRRSYWPNRFSRAT